VVTGERQRRRLPWPAGPGRPRLQAAGVVAAAAAVLLTACGGSVQAGPDGGAVASSAGGAPAPGSSVTLVTYDSFRISKKTLQEFTDATGAEVQVQRSGDGAQVVNRALLTKDSPEGDVLFGVDSNLLSRALDNGLFDPYVAAGADALPAELLEGARGAVTPIDTGDVCVNYDKAGLRSRGLEPPQTLDDLADPRYRGLLVVQNPATSTPGLAFLLASVARYGTDGFAGFWQRLATNDVLVENSWDSAYYRRFSGGSGEGDRPLVVSYATSPAAEVIFSGADNGRAPTGVMLDSCYRQVEYAGVLANADNPAGARALVDFMIGRTYQEDLPLKNFVHPVLPGATVPPEFTDHAPAPQSPLSLAPGDVDAGRDAWVQQWTDVVQP
jgi:thiamine transport system substrate-binding protein